MKNLFKKIFSRNDSEVLKERKQFLYGEDLKFLDNLIDETIEKNPNWGAIKLTNIHLYNEYKKKNNTFKKNAIFQLLHYYYINFSSRTTYTGNDWNTEETLKSIISMTLRMKDVILDLDDLHNIIVYYKKSSNHAYKLPYTPLVTRLENYVLQNGLTPKAKDCLTKLRLNNKVEYEHGEDRKINARISKLLSGQTGYSINQTDFFGKMLSNYLDNIGENDKKNWATFAEQLNKEIGKSLPSKKWMKDTQQLLEKVGHEHASKQFILWFEQVAAFFREIHRNDEETFSFISEDNIQIVRSAIWLSSTINNTSLNQSVEELGLISFKKLPGHGALSVKLGNACIYSFSQLPFLDGIARLTKFRMKIKYPSVQKIIEKNIIQVAKAEGKTVHEIEELAVPEYGINEKGYLYYPIGAFKAIGEISENYKVVLKWEKEGSKAIKSIPKDIKENHSEELKALRTALKDVTSTLSAQRDRIENIFLSKRKWKFNDWNNLYINNSVLSYFGKRLIWRFTNGNQVLEGIWQESNFIDNTGNKIKNSLEQFNVELWHPIFSNANQIKQWRSLIESLKIVQPFKQAHREVYILTDAEKQTNSYSNRFAAHVLRQHIFNALCRQRGWQYQIQGQWDSHNTPSRILKYWNITAEFWVDVDFENGTANNAGIFEHIFSDQVRFYEGQDQLNMEDVPKIVFSEIMRDVDLFVGVTSIGADPNWMDNGEERYNRYWNDYSFGEIGVSGKERKTILESLLPKLAISSKCTFEGNFLVVKGNIRTYKIHLGSGNILMKPNDQYLCIVPDRTKNQNKVFLPFEGDNTLSIVLSKAMMLAHDDKIKDKTIISQISRK